MSSWLVWLVLGLGTALIVLEIVSYVRKRKAKNKPGSPDSNDSDSPDTPS